MNNNKRFLKSILLIIVLVSCIYVVQAQEYYNTEITNKLVEENSFINGPVDTSTPPTFDEIKNKLPRPFWGNHSDAIRTYWKAWEIAFSNLKSVKKNNGFVSPYIDPALNGNIFMWDCSFMTMFGKYGSRAFNFQVTLDNFYSKQHKDGFICREIRGSNGSDVFAKFDPSSTGPNIMPWSEWENYLNTGDKIRLKRVFPVLLAYYEWYKTYKRWPNGTYYSTGWGCGMDNQFRMDEEYNQKWSHGFMSWIDITFQEMFSGAILVEMSKILGKEQQIKEIKHDIESLKSFVNEKMWDYKTNFYYDRQKDGSLSDVKSIASFWALLADGVPEDRIDTFVQHLTDSSEFSRKHRVPTLAANDVNFDPEGGYWNGSVWAPTNYMVLRGLTNYKKDSLAFEIGLNHVENVAEVFSKTNDLRENYAPDYIKGNDGNNFVGWTGLAPISVMFEYVFGFRPNVPYNTLLIDVNLTDSYGVEDYPFGKYGLLNISCNKRINIMQKPIISIESNIPLKIIVKWAGGSFIKEIKPSKNSLK